MYIQIIEPEILRNCIVNSNGVFWKLHKNNCRGYVPEFITKQQTIFSERHEWVSAMDEKVRETHQQENGHIVNVGDRLDAVYDLLGLINGIPVIENGNNGNLIPCLMIKNYLYKKLFI